MLYNSAQYAFTDHNAMIWELPFSYFHKPNTNLNNFYSKACSDYYILFYHFHKHKTHTDICSISHCLPQPPKAQSRDGYWHRDSSSHRLHGLYYIPYQNLCKLFLVCLLSSSYIHFIEVGFPDFFKFDIWNKKYL